MVPTAPLFAALSAAHPKARFPDLHVGELRHSTSS